MKKGPIPVLLVVAHGLGRIFDVSTSKLSRGSSLSSVSSSSDVTVSDSENHDDLPRKPNGVRVVTVEEGLDSASTMCAVLRAEGSRSRSQWLVVWVRGSCMAVVIPPKETYRTLTGKGLTRCLEWLEDVGMREVLMAVPRNGENEVVWKNLLFLGFSQLPKNVEAERLPGWCEGYKVLYTDFTESL